MGIKLTDLPPAVQVQVMQKYAEQTNGRKVREAVPSPAAGNKYRNSPTERVTPSGAVLRFDSRKEARRYDELVLMERAGQIRDLRLQADFTLQEAYTTSQGKRVRAIRYRADFTYRKEVCEVEYDEAGKERARRYEGVLVVEDVKSRATRTKEYMMKRKLMFDRFGIEIQEI